MTGWMVRLAAAAFMLAGMGRAQATWREATSAHFVIYADDRDADAIRTFANRMERFDAAMRVIRKVPPEEVGQGRVTIFVVQDVSALQRLYGAGAQAANVAGFYSPRWTGATAFVPARLRSDMPAQLSLKPTTVLLHEYTHHFFFRNFSGAFPAWFSEAYAEFHSTFDVEPDGSVRVGQPAMHRLFDLVNSDVPVSALLSMGGYPTNERARAALYAKGWLLLHYLTFNKQRDGQLEKYVRLVTQGRELLPAARETFGDLPKLDRELSAYLHGKLPYFVIPAAKLTVAPITVRDLRAGEAAMMDVHMRSTRGVNARTAPRVLADARRVAQPFAADPTVQAWLAEAATDAGAYDEAEAAEARALAADPRHLYALFYRAETAGQRAYKAKATDAATWDGVRRLIVAANRADPDQPGPLVLYYRSYLAQKTAPTKVAVDGLRRAFLLEPEVVELRLLLARADLVTGNVAEARDLLSAILFDPHGKGPGTGAAAVIAAIDEGRRDGLADVMDKAFGTGDATAEN